MGRSFNGKSATGEHGRTAGATFSFRLLALFFVAGHICTTGFTHQVDPLNQTIDFGPERLQPPDSLKLTNPR